MARAWHDTTQKSSGVAGAKGSGVVVKGYVKPRYKRFVLGVVAENPALLVSTSIKPQLAAFTVELAQCCLVGIDASAVCERNVANDVTLRLHVSPSSRSLVITTFHRNGQSEIKNSQHTSL